MGNTNILRRFRKPFLILILGVVVLLAVECAIITGYGLFSRPAPADVAIVYGNRIEADGQPCPRLAARLDRALTLYQAGTCQHMLVSGGVGIEGFDEATVMRDYLVARGVPESRVIADSEGVNSRATAVNAARLMEANDWKGAIVVTQYWHIARARIACRQAGIAPLSSAYPVYVELRDLYSIAREMLAVPAYWLQGPG
jgi:vancomycin permeability regulator SanA